MRSISLIFVVAAAMAALPGCSRSSRLGVSGMVTLDGQPLESGNIAFETVSLGGPTAGAAIERGAYNVPAEQGLLPGEYKVRLHAFRGTGKKTWDGMGDPNAPASQKHFVEEMEQYIPPRYNDATELTASIAPQKTTGVNFDLTVKGARKGK